MPEELSADPASSAAAPPAESVTHSSDEAPPAVPRQSAPDAAAGPPATVQEGVATPLPTRPTHSPALPPESAVAPPAEPAPAQAAPKAPEAARDPAEPLVVVTTLPPEKRGRGPVITLIIAIVVLSVLAIVAYFFVQRIYADPTRDAAVGDCLTSLPVVDPGQDKEARGARVVDCGDATASHRVEGRLDNQSAEQARSAEICKAYPEATFIYRAVPDSGNGYVLCLKKLTP